jgi:homoserine acetyltransferase
MKINVWDGTTVHHPNLGDVKNPDHSDYLMIVSKIQELEIAFNNTYGNLTLLPLAQDLFDEIDQKVLVLKAQIDALALPEDVKKQLTKIEAQIVAHDVRKDVLIARRDILELAAALDRNKRQLLELQSMVQTEVTAFQSKVHNTLKKLDMEVRDRLDKVEKKVEQQAIQSHIQTLLEELK